jgi:MYXO-CTERM domain-containing protein
MFPSKAYKALFVALLGIVLGCGDSRDEGWGDVEGAAAEVVGGWAATTDQIFATVEIRRGRTSMGFCSGTLISPLIVVTAAHCAVVEPEPGVVSPAEPGTLWVAEGHLVSRSATDAMLRIVTEVHVHEEYDHDFIMGRSRDGAGQGGIGSPNDIALLILESPFEDAPLAPLLTTEREAALVHHGDVGFVAGYGVYDLDEGSTGELYISDAVIDIIGQQELLTRRSDQLGDSCYGDSGGPLYVPTDYGDFLVGLVSRGRSDVKRDCGDGGVYTLLSVHLPWIARTAQDRFQPILDSGDQNVSFLQDGAGPISAPKGGSLQRAKSCAASPPGSDGQSPISALALLAGLLLWSRRLSRR